jgi:hypothetical protein
VLGAKFWHNNFLALLVQHPPMRFSVVFIPSPQQPSGQGQAGRGCPGKMGAGEGCGQNEAVSQRFVFCRKKPFHSVSI